MDFNNLKNEIKDIELDFDQNEVWANIQGEQRNERRRIAFWLSSVLGVLLLVVGAFHLLDRPDENDLILRDISAENKVSVNEGHVTSSSPLILPEGETIINNSENEYLLERQNVISESKQRLKVLSTDNILFNSSTTKTEEERNNVRNRKIDSNRNSKIEISVEQKNSEKNVEYLSMTGAVKDNSKTASHSMKSMNSAYRRKIITQEQITTEEYVSETTEMDNSSSEPQIDSDIAIVEIEDGNSKVEVEPLRNSNNAFLTVKAIVEYGILNRSLGLENKEIQNLLLTQRESSEKAMDHWIAGVHVSMPIGKILFVNTGIEFHRMTDKLEYGKNSIRPITLGDLPLGVIDAQGYVVSKTNSVYYNHLDLVNVPLEVGARWAQSRFSQFVSLGTSLNLKTNGRLLYLNEFQNLENNDNEIKKKFNNSYVLKTGVTYSLFPQLDLSLNASYRFMPNVLVDNTDFTQSYQSYMLGTAIGYKF